jgi:hypothetical protein
MQYRISLAGITLILGLIFFIGTAQSSDPSSMAGAFVLARHSIQLRSPHQRKIYFSPIYLA